MMLLSGQFHYYTSISISSDVNWWKYMYIYAYNVLLRGKSLLSSSYSNQNYISLLRGLRALVWEKNTLWARPCLSIAFPQHWNSFNKNGFYWKRHLFIRVRGHVPTDLLPKERYNVTIWNYTFYNIDWWTCPHYITYLLCLNLIIA